MKNTEMIPLDTATVFDDPVAYLALCGVEAELVDQEVAGDTTYLAAAA